jgi:hypothetical protein
VERKGSEEEDEEEGASMAVVSVLPFTCKRKGRPREMEVEEENNRNAKGIVCNIPTQGLTGLIGYLYQ